jgi:hypothetical protein
MASFRLKIRGRLHAGFAALVAVGLVMGAVAVWNLWAVQDQVAKISTLSDGTARVLEISSHLQAIQRANLRYIHDGNQPALKEAADRETAATELLQVEAKATLSAERRELYNDLISDIAKMRTLRGNLGDAVNETRTGRAILLPGGDEVSAKAAKLGIAARPSHDAEVTAGVADIESKILLARIASWRFLALHDNKGASSFKTSVDNAQQKLAALESATLPAEVQSAVASVKTSLTTYKNAFDTTSAAMLKADDIYGNNISPLIARSIDKLKAAETGLKSEYRASRATAEAAMRARRRSSRRSASLQSCSAASSPT